MPSIFIRSSNAYFAFNLGTLKNLFLYFPFHLKANIRTVFCVVFIHFMCFSQFSNEQRLNRSKNEMNEQNIERNTTQQNRITELNWWGISMNSSLFNWIELEKHFSWENEQNKYWGHLVDAEKKKNNIIIIQYKISIYKLMQCN